MPNHIDIAGVIMLVCFIVGVQLLSIIRTVKSIKTHAHTLLQMRDDAVQNAKYSIHYDNAHRLMYELQKEKLTYIRHTFLGSLVAKVLTDSYYEIPQT